MHTFSLFQKVVHPHNFFVVIRKITLPINCLFYKTTTIDVPLCTLYRNLFSIPKLELCDLSYQGSLDSAKAIKATANRFSLKCITGLNRAILPYSQYQPPMRPRTRGNGRGRGRQLRVHLRSFIVLYLVLIQVSNFNQLCAAVYGFQSVPGQCCVEG